MDQERSKNTEQGRIKRIQMMAYFDKSTFEF